MKLSLLTIYKIPQKIFNEKPLNTAWTWQLQPLIILFYITNLSTIMNIHQ